MSTITPRGTFIHTTESGRQVELPNTRGPLKVSMIWVNLTTMLATGTGFGLLIAHFMGLI